MENITVTMPMKEYEELKRKETNAYNHTRDLIAGLFGELLEDQDWVNLANDVRLRKIIEALRRGRLKQ